LCGGAESGCAPGDRIAAVIPYYPFKGIDRFYDISGLLLHPPLFQRTIDLLTERYRSHAITKIGGFDARGFLLGPPVALALNIPFFMLRKKGKMPNSITGTRYSKVRMECRGGRRACARLPCVIPPSILLRAVTGI
jgi:adenine phosphoribosyltransferase